MLWKNLARRATPTALEAAYAELGLSRNARAEELSPDSLFALYEALRA
jgi:16S rRNA A1518/A1519 N6-dimethyltransferase RsmA/KsgA/DIM1 with predicted DNA glycosylase/AP lyase activity